jgi:hypothetical protein
MKPIIGEPRADGLVSLDMPLLAKSLGFTKPAFDKKLSSFAFQQVWSEARRLAHQRNFARGEYLQVSVTDEDLLEAASRLLNSPIQFSCNRVD